MGLEAGMRMWEVKVVASWQVQKVQRGRNEAWKVSILGWSFYLLIPALIGEGKAWPVPKWSGW